MGLGGRSGRQTEQGRVREYDTAAGFRMLLPSSCLPSRTPCLQGESMMRKALAELKLWGLQREFELSETSSQVGGGIHVCGRL